VKTAAKSSLKFLQNSIPFHHTTLLDLTDFNQDALVRDNTDLQCTVCLADCDRNCCVELDLVDMAPLSGLLGVEVEEIHSSFVGFVVLAETCHRTYCLQEGQ